MFRSPDRRQRRWGIRLLTPVALAAVTVGTVHPAWALPPASAPDAAGPVVDIVGEVVSLDGTESEARRDNTLTLGLTNDVLFTLDKADLSAKARDRLAGVAARIKADGAGGPIRVEGHTDDQGSDSYNNGLSQRRAEAVRKALAQLLSGQNVTLQAKGFGESRPKVPNVVDGKPNEANRAKNRRVEITFNVKN